MKSMTTNKPWPLKVYFFRDQYDAFTKSCELAEWKQISAAQHPSNCLHNKMIIFLSEEEHLHILKLERLKAMAEAYEEAVQIINKLAGKFEKQFSQNCNCYSDVYFQADEIDKKAAAIRAEIEEMEK